MSSSVMVVFENAGVAQYPADLDPENPGADYGPGANMSAPRQDCYIPPYQDSAYEKFAAASGGFVSVGPKTEANACRNPVDGTHLSGASNTQAAKDVAAYYAAHP